MLYFIIASKASDDDKDIGAVCFYKCSLKTNDKQFQGDL